MEENKLSLIQGLWIWPLVAMGHKITNVPLILKITLWAISRDILRGPQLFLPLKISLEMAHKVICPQKKSPAFSKSAVKMTLVQ